MKPSPNDKSLKNSFILFTTCWVLQLKIDQYLLRRLHRFLIVLLSLNDKSSKIHSEFSMIYHIN